jgi:hypothetical protein
MVFCTLLQSYKYRIMRLCSTQLVNNFTPWLLKEENWNHVHATIDEIKAKAFFARRPSFIRA